MSQQTGQPSVRVGQAAVWTGNEMIVWGGNGIAGSLGDGARYDPSKDRWIPVAADGAPSPRANAVATWTGSEMIIWGGYVANGRQGGGLLTDGARYNPVTDTWTPMSSIGAPDGRVSAAAVWTGNLLLVWGGIGQGGARELQSGAAYDPRGDTWAPISVDGAPSARWSPGAVWTGSEMLIWGGGAISEADRSGLAVGGAYSPVSNSWRRLPPADAPIDGAAVWTGTHMVVWNGKAGAAYHPASQTWAPISVETGVPERFERSHPNGFTLVWTGREVLLWGGAGGVRPIRYFGDGARYDPDTDTWSPIPTVGAPAGTDRHSAVWTGTEMLIWPGGGSEGIGGAYRPYWLAVRSPTQAYGVDDSPLFVAQPGELYRVIQFQDDWALVQANGDPPSLEEWVAIDERVELSTPFPPDPAP